MVTQAHPIPAAACALPEIPESAVYDLSYIVAAPDVLTLVEFKAQALAIVADAGLPTMPVSVQHDLDTTDETLYRLYPHEPVFDTIAVYAYGPTHAQALAHFSRRLGIWARRAGLLPAVQLMEGGPARA